MKSATIDHPSAACERLVILNAATIVRAGGEIALRNIDWTVHEGECWAVVGPMGSGKTTLAEVLLGRHRVESGSVGWPLLERLRAAGGKVGWPSDVIRHVAFKEDSGLFSYGRHYYQQRFNFVEPHDDLTLDVFLRAGSPVSGERIHATAQRLGIADLLSLSLIKLSNGQMRRARIARALLARPELLILDEPFVGLDAAGRVDVADVLGELVRGGTRVLLITRPDSIPVCVTHVLGLDRLEARWSGTRARFLEVHAERDAETMPSRASEPTLDRPQSGPAIIELRNVTVTYGDRPMLADVSWTVHAGERWAVLGPNGSGKTTLLSLICGDHPQAYSNDIRLFGQPRGSGESIWEIKHRIGLVSPELHLYFTAPLTAFATAATGFFDVLVYRSTSPEQDARILELFDHFALTSVADRPFARLSTGEQRLVLLIRALVKAPPVLILDEPFQGLDERGIHHARDWLDSRLDPAQTLIFVSHLLDEIPRTVNQQLWLEMGRVVTSP